MHTLGNEDTVIKISTVAMDYRDVLALPRAPHKRPQKPDWFFRLLLQAVSRPELKKAGFRCSFAGMEQLGKRPCLILMNHSSFIDLKIAEKIFFPRPLSIVCTSDGFVGKAWLMRSMGCIPTQKFVSDVALVRDIQYAIRKLNCSVLLFPEASYTFDGTCTPLPASLGKLLKLLKVPVVSVLTHGAFARDPLYNGLQVRDVPVEAKVTYLLSPEKIADLSVPALNALLKETFTFDNFRWQQEQGLKIDAPFRADGLNRILYKCPHCQGEGHMLGEGTTLICKKCGKRYQLTELGQMAALEGDTAYPHIPDWYAWERACVKQEILAGTYCLDIPVRIRMLVDYRHIYDVGQGRLLHTAEGFHLTGCNGELDYRQSPAASYSLYSDYYWYEIGDMISIGDREKLFYCFPETTGDVVAKTRLATEELYRLESGTSAPQTP